MKVREFFTKTEYGLLILTALFLLIVSAVLYVTGPKPSSADYTVTTERTAEGVTPAVEPERPAGRVNLNTATAEELQTLPGIGEVLAARIVAHREENGPFTCPEELMTVKGIGESLFDALQDQITTEE